MEQLSVKPEQAGLRLDAFLVAQRPEHSRARWQQLIREDHVRVNGQARKASHEVHAGEVIEFEIPPPTPVGLVAQDIPLNILFEDTDVIVINKPPDLVVHPAAGHAEGTLVNALLHHCADLAGIGGEQRPGIVHRLDMDTSGVLVVAKSEQAMSSLTHQFKNHLVQKEYMALVWGVVEPRTGHIETLIGRSTHDRKKMSTNPEIGRQALTDYEVLEQFDDAAVLRVRIHTGRTHQIRVHLAHIGHAVIGDTVYGRARKADLPAPADRQMLHAHQLAFEHPRTGQPLSFTAPIPEDFRALWRAFRARGGSDAEKFSGHAHEQ